MAKNYATLYNSTNDSISLEQRVYAKLETTRGTFVQPTDSDFFLQLPGGAINFEQPFESSPQRSGRHHNNIIKKKKTTAWNFSTYLNIDTGAGDGKSSVDTPLKLLWKSLLGKEDVSGADAIYTTEDAPDLTFSLFEVGDKWSRQSRGAFVLGGNLQLPGDGEASVEWTGNAKDAFLTGIGKTTTDNNTGNTITLQTGEGDRFNVGSQIMLVEADGTTRSADTAAPTARTVTAITGDILTVDGAALADADGSGADIYVSYYEPEAPSAIDNPVTGLIGSVSIVGLSDQCVRSLGVNMQNNHELVDYCYGEDALAGKLYVPGDRMTAEITMSLNLNDDLVEFYNQIQNFNAKNITAVLGDSAGRHLEVLLPRVFFPVPGFSVPDTGSIPIEFSGTAYQTALDAADEITVTYK